MNRILLIFYLIFPMGIIAARRRCVSSGIPFSGKVLRSPIIVYGESIAKRVYLDTDNELLFNVTFRVDCILKGIPIESQIEITDAGIKALYTACQWLDPGHKYVVFLEKWGINTNGYRPVDFQEHIIDRSTIDFLATTCHLTHILPLHTTQNNCPNVSMPIFCPHDKDDISVMPKQDLPSDIKPQIKSSYFDRGHSFYLQSNVTVPKDGVIIRDSDLFSKNSACLGIINGILIVIMILMMI